MLDGTRRSDDSLARVAVEQPIADGVRAQLPEDFFLKHGDVPSKESERRRFARRYYRVPARAKLLGLPPLFPRHGQCAAAYLSDFSRGGVAFFCDRQLFPGESVELEFPRVGFRTVVVKRCRRLTAGCFEIGCTFGKSSNS
ncbi:MAG: hypothetical protein C0483_05000 [Pirellula sp.]|nr:hypothetical protein [Pirellula sp.]